MAYRTTRRRSSGYSRSGTARRTSRAGARRSTARRSTRRVARPKAQEIRLVIEGVNASSVSRGEAILQKMNPPPKRAKY